MRPSRMAAVLALLSLAWAAPGADIPLATWCDDGADIDQALADLGYGAQPLEDVDGLLAEGPMVAIVQARAERLRSLHAHQQAIETWLGHGGWIVLDGLDDSGLASFDALVGVPHRLRPFRSERVTLTGTGDPLGQQLDPWAAAMRHPNQGWGEVWVSPDAYGPVVDTDDWAPFATLPDPSYFHHPDAANDHNPLNLVDGFGSAESWKRVFALYPGRSRMDIPFRFGEPVRIRAVNVVTSFVYPGITKVGIACDDGAAQTLATDAPGDHLLTFDPPREVRTVTVSVQAWNHNGRGVIGIDDIHILPEHPAGWSAHVHPLTSVGALVAYPHGAGGILLCQLPFRAPGVDADHANVHRRLTLLRQLLLNLHAHHGPRALAPPTEHGVGTPVPLTLAGGPALTPVPAEEGPWPTGTRTFAGVHFRLPDAPAAVVLSAGHHATIPMEGPVHALFLLLGATATGTAPAAGTVLGHLRIRYADDRTLTVPLVEGEDCATTSAADGPLIDRSQRVWQVDDGHRHGCLYLRQWDNPTPAVAIASVTIDAEMPQGALWLAGLSRLDR